MSFDRLECVLKQNLLFVASISYRVELNLSSRCFLVTFSCLSCKNTELTECKSRHTLTHIENITWLALNPEGLFHPHFAATRLWTSLRSYTNILAIVSQTNSSWKVLEPDSRDLFQGLFGRALTWMLACLELLFIPKVCDAFEDSQVVAAKAN